MIRCPSAALHRGVIKRDLAKIHMLRLHKMLKNLLERPKKIPVVDLLSVEANDQSVLVLKLSPCSKCKLFLFG